MNNLLTTPVLTFNNPFRLLKESEGALCRMRFDLSEISLRSLNINSDLFRIYKWLDKPHIKRFWQLDCSFKELYQLYLSIQSSQHTHSLVGLYDSETVCQIDLYRPSYNGVGNHYRSTPCDIGLHLLMAPMERNHIKGLSVAIIRLCSAYLFQFSEVKRLIAEPDIENIKAHALLQRCGFKFQKEMLLSDKKAKLYLLSKEES